MTDLSRLEIGSDAEFVLASDSLLDVDCFVSGTLYGTGTLRTVCSMMTGTAADTIRLICLTVRNETLTVSATIQVVREYTFQTAVGTEYLIPAAVEYEYQIEKEAVYA